MTASFAQEKWAGALALWDIARAACLGIRTFTAGMRKSPPELRTWDPHGNKWQSGALTWANGKLIFRIAKSSQTLDGPPRSPLCRPLTSLRDPAGHSRQGFSFYPTVSEHDVGILVGLQTSNEAGNETRSVCCCSFAPSDNCRCCRRSNATGRQSWRRDWGLFETSVAELFSTVSAQRRSSNQCSFSNSEPSLTLSIRVSVTWRPVVGYRRGT